MNTNCLERFEDCNACASVIVVEMRTRTLPHSHNLGQLDICLGVSDSFSICCCTWLRNSNGCATL